MLMRATGLLVQLLLASVVALAALAYLAACVLCAVQSVSALKSSVTER
jgi:hypothetical protein